MDWWLVKCHGSKKVWYDKAKFFFVEGGTEWGSLVWYFFELVEEFIPVVIVLD